jgi:hypothetical protein
MTDDAVLERVDRLKVLETIQTFRYEVYFNRVNCKPEPASIRVCTDTRAHLEGKCCMTTTLHMMRV